MLSSLAFLYIPLLFPCLIRRHPFFSEFLTQILYLSSLSLFPIYFTNPCCQPLFPNLSSQLLSPTSLPYPCSQSILPTPVAKFLFLDPFSQPQFPALVPKLCSIPPFPTPVSNYFFNPCYQLLFLILVPCSLPFFPYVWCQPLLPTSVPNSCSQLLFPTFFHFPCSQPLFIIPVPNPVFKSFCFLTSALYLCFQSVSICSQPLFLTFNPNLYLLTENLNVRFLYIAGSCCIRQKGIPKSRNISFARSETRTFCALLQGTVALLEH